MDLKYLETFKVILQEGSFSKAAKKLNYAQSAITFQMQQLEKDLCVKLFEKVGRNMVITKTGERMISYVDEVLSAVAKLQFAETNLLECEETLKMGIAESQLCYKMPMILKEFHKQAPKARLLIQSMNCYDIRDKLLDGTLDVGIFYEDVHGFGSNLTVYPLGNYSLTLVSSPSVKKQYPDFISADQKLDIPFIINEEHCIFREIFEKYLRDKSILIDHTIELWSIPTIKKMVESDLGISYLPYFAVEEELKAGTLVEIDTDIKAVHISAVCGYHKNKWISPLIQKFIDLLTTLYQ